MIIMTIAKKFIASHRMHQIIEDVTHRFRKDTYIIAEVRMNLKFIESFLKYKLKYNFILENEKKLCTRFGINLRCDNFVDECISTLHRLLFCLSILTPKNFSILLAYCDFLIVLMVFNC